MVDLIQRNGENISVVVQGAIDVKVYKEVAESIRYYLPGAEIVLSTWEGTDISEIDYDKAVINEDPGGLQALYRDNKKTVLGNINRQIVSTRNGVKEAARDYVMKLRSDSVITGLGFLNYADRFLSTGKYLCFEPRNPWGNFKEEYCLCDFWFFGEKEDILKLWDIPLYIPRTERGFDMLAEEYLVECSVVPTSYGGSKESKYLFLLRNRAVIIPTRKSGIKSLKYPNLNGIQETFFKHYVISHEDWKRINGIATMRNYLVSAISGFSGQNVLWIKSRMGK